METWIVPRPPEEERDAIVAALAEEEAGIDAWTQAALREGVDRDAS
ncbi:MAG TPA: hypothetical protein VNT58_08840 [Gaiellaceae bacterium]|nr:hypothetical protein [Gaiellaceae bacterium]